MDEQLLSFKVDENGITMNISLEDLKYLFENSEVNFDGEDCYAKIKDGKEVEFAKKVVKVLQDDDPYDPKELVWSTMFTHAFEEIVEDASDDVLNYREEN